MSAGESLKRRPGVSLELPCQAFDLDCGARLLVSPRPAAPVTAVRVHLRGGRSGDPQGLGGLALMVGALADQGTKKYDEETISKLLMPAGGAVAGDANGLSGTVAGDDWKLLCEIMASMLTEPSYPAGPVARQKERAMGRLMAEAQDPRVQGSRLLRGLVYGDHWLARPERGTVDSLVAITPAKLRAHQRRTWVASRAMIAVCGALDAERVRRQWNRLLRGWKSGRPHIQTPLSFPAPGKRVAAFNAKRAQVHVHLGHLGVRRSNPDYPALVLLDHILGTGPGFTDRISRRLRDELGLAYSVSAAIHNSAGLAPGMFRAYIGTSKEHVGTAVAAFLEEMRRIRDEPVAVEELELARDYLLGSYPLGFERASRRAAFLVTREVHGFGDSYLEDLIASFKAVTTQDVQRAARAHLWPERCCLAAAGPVNKAELRRALG
ncbi:MAG: pitrilysin family protein [Planctomycetota bacterium]|nr:pitrilysin family protein [Planctomycetota bacterium]